MGNKRKPSTHFTEALYFTATAVALIILHSLICTHTQVKPVLSGTFMCVLYLAFAAAYFVIRRNLSATKGISPLPAAVNVLSNAMVTMPDPVVICHAESDRIIWFNNTAAELFGRRNTIFSDIFSTDCDSEGEMRLVAGGRRYVPESFSAQGNGGKPYTVFIMRDVTESDKQTELLRGKQCAAAYVTVDNLEELLNYEQEDYRTASGDAESILRRWATEHGGVLKEYQQDKYIFLFEQSHVKEFTENGFDVLDRVREICVGDAGIPVTVSIGMSVGEGTLLEREREAQAALKTALQRGGDQAVVKINGEVEIYGGRTKTQQKRTAVRARVVANELESLMKGAANVLVMGHRFADFDAFGACVGIAAMAKHLGVKVNIISDLDDSNLDRCRAWIRSEKGYEGIFVDREGALDMIEPDTLLIIADVNNPAQFESKAVAEKCEKKVIIDHHRKTAGKDNDDTALSYIEPAASAASELVAEMLEQVLPADTLTPKEADLILAGILLDTNHFTKNTGTRTFSAALYLRGCGADVGEVQVFFKTELEDFRRELQFHENVEIYRGICAIATAKNKCTFKDKVPAAKAADKLLGVEGVRASFTVVPIGDEVHISARSTGKINVQLLLEKLNGGGHFDSAGTRLEGTTAEKAVTMLKSAIDSYFNEKNIKAGE